MAPNCSKHYPITTSVFSCIPPTSSKRYVPPASCQFDSPTSLAHLRKAHFFTLFTYDIFLTECVLKYPYKEKKVDEWFSVPVKRDDNEEDGDATNVQVINTTRDGLSNLIEEKEQPWQQQPGQRLYYHGTDHDSAKSILKEGGSLQFY